MSSSIATAPISKKSKYYVPRGRNVLHTIFEKHFTDFCDVYEDQYADKYGKFHLDRIMAVGEHFVACGDYLNGLGVSAAQILHVDMIISAHSVVKGFICAHPVVKKEHYSWQNI